MTHACRELSAIGRARDLERTFICPEESERYASALEQLVFNRFRRERLSPTVIEFGSGTGAPVITAIKASEFAGVVHGYEINPDAVDTAEQAIEACGLEHRYVVHNASFFDTQRRPPSDFLIANPPYIPCDDGALLTLPDLCGGPDGTEVSKLLLAAGYPNVFLEVSSYSNPASIVEQARRLGYRISDFLITQMPFGPYSRQNVVQARLREMKVSGLAFYSERCYLVGSVYFTKLAPVATDLSAEFLGCLTGIGRI